MRFPEILINCELFRRLALTIFRTKISDLTTKKEKLSEELIKMKGSLDTSTMELKVGVELSTHCLVFMYI